MTKRDFEFIAGTISNIQDRDVRQTVTQEFTDNLRIVNPRFDFRIFAEACRVNYLTVPAHELRVGDRILTADNTEVIHSVVESNKTGVEIEWGFENAPDMIWRMKRTDPVKWVRV